MLVGALVGMFIRFLLPTFPMLDAITETLSVGGTIFITLMKMLVVPIVFVSLVSGVCALGDTRKLGRIGGQTILLYLFTTALAISLAVTFALLFHLGEGMNLATDTKFQLQGVPSLKDVIINIFPSNPFEQHVAPLPE